MGHTGKVERFRLPGIQAAKIHMNQGDVLPLHDHPYGSACMLVVSGKVNMKIFRRLSQDGEIVILELAEDLMLLPGDVATLECGDQAFHIVESLDDSYIFDAFSCDEPEKCVSIFYQPLTEDLTSGPFQAKRIAMEEADLPDYFIG